MLQSVLPLLVLCAPGGLVRAQSANERPVYTYVADYGVPRANWQEFTERWEKQSLPVLERLFNDGTLVEFGASANVVHTKEGSTHSYWWSSMTIAGTQRVLAELAKNAAPAPVAGMTHHDRLLRSVVYRARTNRITSGFSDVNVFYIKQGKAEEWRKFYDKYTVPVMERLLEQGTILGYGVDAEMIHTEKMGARFGWTMYPNAEAIDKVNEAFQAERKKYSPDEVKTAMTAFSELTDTDAHRDGMDRIIYWSRK